MEMKEIKSSAIAAIGHDGETLRVRFQGGREYDYPGVSAEAFTDLLNAESAGQHFRQMDLGKGSRVEDEDDQD